MSGFYKWNDLRLTKALNGIQTDLVSDTTPQLGGNLDLNSNAFVAVLLAGETLVNGDVCYMFTDSRMYKADASADASARGMLGICTESLSAGEAGTFVIRGFYTTTGLSAGTLLYLSTTAGDWSASTPTGTGEIVRVLGYAITATQMFFDPDRTWIELA